MPAATTTRRRFKTIADAAQDRRVGYADAGVAYRRAIVKARADRTAALRRVEERWHVACARACSLAVQRRAMRVTYRAMADEDLLDLYRRYEYMLTDAYSQYRDVALEETTEMSVRAMRPVIAARGLVP
jgi:hypothetical protein